MRNYNSNRRAYNSNAIKCELDGIKFDSRAEMRYWKTLRLLERSGQISDLEAHPKFELQPAFTLLDEKHRAITYEADMRYIEDGVIVIVDVKAMKWTRGKRKRIPVRDEFRRTKRLFLYRYKPKFESGEWRYEVVDASNV